jgi:DNA-binding winged helix-turn-helix (wHTH) protein
MNFRIEQAPLRIGAFRLDRTAQRLWHNGEPIELVPQVWALLTCFVEHAGELLTKHEILQAAWPGAIVSDMALSQAVHRLRTAFGDDARQPSYIQTVHRRGFRLIAPVRVDAGAPTRLPAAARAEADALFVGRGTERTRLEELLRAARSGARQVVFLEGGAGIGKTALLNTFLQKHGDDGLQIAAAQCIEQHGSTEPYMPVFEALDRSARSSRDTVEVLRRHAPTWLAQMPWLLKPDEVRGLEGAITDATRARMLREMSHTLEVLAAERPLVLVLEDLHWADAATVDLLASIARRTDPAQIIVLGSYRPVEAIAYDHPIVPLVRALAVDGVCTRLGLESLGRADVHEYLLRRFSAQALAASLHEPLHRRSEGNPMFLVAIVDWLVERGLVGEGSAGWQLTQAIDENDLRDIPQNLREMVELQLKLLDTSELELLQAASAAAVEFRAASVAAAFERPGQAGVDAVGETCQLLLARRQLLRAAGEETWPDGTRTARYAFRHELYRQVLYESLPASRRRRLHRRIGERMEQAFAGDLRRVATDLARHFDSSGDDAKAVAYFVLAARQAHRRHADREAADFLRSALRHLDSVPAGPARDLQELQMRIGVVLAHWLAELDRPDEDETHLARIQALLSGFTEDPVTFQLSSRLWSVYTQRSLPDLAEPLADRMVAIAARGDKGQQMEAYIAKGMTASMHGRFAQAVAHYASALDLFGEGTPPACAGFPGYATTWEDAGCRVYGYSGMALLISGAPDRASAHLRRTIELCGGRRHPKHAAAAFLSLAGICCLLGDLDLARTASDRGVAIAEEHAFTGLVAAAAAQRLWLAIKTGSREGSAPAIQAAWENYQRSRRAIPAPVAPLLLVDACRMTATADLGLAIVDRVWRDLRETGLRWLDAELQRLKGELILLQGRRTARTQAAASFHRALEIARAQGARFYELRAATSLARLCRGHRNQGDARGALERIYAEFTEGFETPDLQAAAACLHAVAPVAGRSPRLSPPSAARSA